MLRKSLLLTVCLSFFSIPLALADNDPVRQEHELYWGQRVQVQAQNTVVPTLSHVRAYQEDGTCFSERDGRGRVINWADTKSKCGNTCGSWVSIGGDVRNYERGNK